MDDHSKILDPEQIPFLERATLSCADIEELVDCYIDGEMVAALAIRFEKHLESCETCRDMVLDCRHLVGVARTLDEKPLDEEIRARLRQVLKLEFGFPSDCAVRPRLSVVKHR